MSEFTEESVIFSPALSLECFLGNDYLLTLSEVCTGKYLLEVFLQVKCQKSEVCVK